MTAYMDQCTRVYTRTGLSAHLLRPEHSPGGDEALCGLLPAADGWRGTSTQAEHERAASLPVCKPCVKSAAVESAAMGVLRGLRDG